MKNILISIKPEHCCNILNRDKILEIRTTCPAEWKKYLDGKTIIKPEPCKVCIYCTKDNKNYLNRKDCRFCYIEKRDVLGITDKVRELFDNIDSFYERLNGKVIAEFTLNEIDKIERDLNDWLPKNRYETTAQQLKNSCLTEEKFWGYGKGKTLYAWHIDNLTIYDKPKELSDFTKVLDCKYCIDYNRMDSGFICPDCINANILKRPPQSWCYVEGE